MVSGSTDSSKMKPALKKDLLMILPDPVVRFSLPIYNDLVLQL